MEWHLHVSFRRYATLGAGATENPDGAPLRIAVFQNPSIRNFMKILGLLGRLCHPLSSAVIPCPNLSQVAFPADLNG